MMTANPKEEDETAEPQNKKQKLVKQEAHDHDPLTSMIKNVPKQPKRHLSDLMYIEHHENGGGYALHIYSDELCHLNKDELNLLVRKFFKNLFGERSKKPYSVPFSYYSIGVVHGAAKPIPNLLNYLATKHPNMKITTNSLENKNATLNMSMQEFTENVYKNYSKGIFRFGPLHAISLVGTKGEEKGFMCDEIIQMIENDPFLHEVTPWGPLSEFAGEKPQESDDGPILWIRPGEQSIPLKVMSPKIKHTSADISELLSSNGRVNISRQVLVVDRTPCHADHSDEGVIRHTTAAVGILKAIDPVKSKFKSTGDTKGCYYSRLMNESKTHGRICKDVVVFDPRHYPDLVKRLSLDIMEPPASQCSNFWADDGELNMLRSEGYRYVRLSLRDNDIYFIPRNVVHQFKTVSAVISVAWHVRLSNYKDNQIPKYSKEFTDSSQPPPPPPPKS